jgi:hypothetical protein
MEPVAIVAKIGKILPITPRKYAAVTPGWIRGIKKPRTDGPGF